MSQDDAVGLKVVRCEIVDSMARAPQKAATMSENLGPEPTCRNPHHLLHIWPGVRG